MTFFHTGSWPEHESTIAHLCCQNSPFPRYFKCKSDRETFAPERGYGKYISAARETVPRGVIYCCVPLCHSYSGKVVNKKAVKLHRLPKETKARRIWIARLGNVRQNFSAKSGTRVCSLHFKGEEGPKPWCQCPSCSPLSQSRNPSFNGIELCLTDRGNQRHLQKCKRVES